MSNALSYKWYDPPIDPDGKATRREEDWRFAGETFPIVFTRGDGSSSTIDPGDTVKVVIAESETSVALVTLTATIAGDGLSFTATLDGTLTRSYAGRFSVLAWNETRSTALAQEILGLRGNQLYVAGDLPNALTGFVFGIGTGYRVATNADLNGLLDDDAAASRTALGLGSAATHAAADFQPIDSDLTAIAALSTQTFGRSLLTASTPAALVADVGIPNFVNANEYFNGTIYYVSATGNDSNAGTSPSAAWLTLSHAASVATVAGTLVCVGAGTFGPVVWSDGVSVFGSGIDVTVVASDNGGTDNVIYRPGSNSEHRDMTIQQNNRVAAVPSFVLPFGCNYFVDDGRGFSNITLRRAKIIGGADGIFISGVAALDYASLRTIDCVIDTLYDCFNCSDTHTTVYTEHHNLTMIANGAYYGTNRGIVTNLGTHVFYGGSITVAVSGPNSEFQEDTAGVETYVGGKVILFGTKITVTNTGTGTTNDLYNISGSISVFGAYYSTSSGTISSFSGSNTGDQTTVSGNAGSATVLQTARNIVLGGALSGTTSFNGSANVTISASIASGATIPSPTLTGTLIGTISASGVTAGVANAAPASGLTGATLASNVLVSSLTSVGALQSLTVNSGGAVSTVQLGDGSNGNTVKEAFGEANLTSNVRVRINAAGGEVVIQGSSPVRIRDFTDSNDQSLRAQAIGLLTAIADAAAPNGYLFVGSDHSNKLCFKDSGGTVRVLY